jgi:hypothetical protein
MSEPREPRTHTEDEEEAAFVARAIGFNNLSTLPLDICDVPVEGDFPFLFSRSEGRRR